VDVDGIRANLELTPTERLLKLERSVNSLQEFRDAVHAARRQKDL
jgi:hypothetical protein